jgi:hypothetical protein
MLALVIRSFGDATTERLWSRQRSPKLDPRIECFVWTDAGPAHVEIVDPHSEEVRTW